MLILSFYIISIKIYNLISKESIEKLSEEKFEKNKESVITKLLEKPKNLAIQTATFIKSVESKNYDFGRGKEKMILNE